MFCTWTSRTSHRESHRKIKAQLLGSFCLWSKIKINIKPAACCLTRTLHYTNSVWYLKHKICKKCTFQKPWKSAIQVQLLTTQRDCFSQTEAGLLFFIFFPLTSFFNCFPLKRVPRSAPEFQIAYIYTDIHDDVQLCKNMVFTKVEKMTFDWKMTKIFG